MPPIENPIPLDYFFLSALLLITILGYWRGLGKEIIQLILFLLGTVSTFLVFDTSIQIHNVADIIPTLKFLGIFMACMFVVTFLVAKSVTTYLFIEEQLTESSRISGAIFAAAKTFTILIALNLAFAIVNPYANRFRTMPNLVKESQTLQTTDAITENIYLWLAEKNIVSYKKYTHKPKTDKEIQQEQLMERLKINLPPKPW